MSTQERLDAYIAAEARILRAQQVRFGERQVVNPELAEVRRQISILQAQVQRESLAVRGHSAIGYSLANFTGSDG